MKQAGRRALRCGARCSFGRAGGRVGLPKQSGEVPELGETEIGDHPVSVVRRGPVQQVIALAGAGRGNGGRTTCGGPEEHVDQVLAPAVRKSGHRAPIHVVESASEQGVPSPGEVVHGGREVELSVEPWLHRVLIRRGHVGEMAGHELADVAREDVTGERLTGRALKREAPAAGGDDRE